jgi:HEAT repeat protein
VAQAVPILVAALNDPAFDVRKTAWRALKAIDPKRAAARAAPAVVGLADQLKAERPEEQAWAADILGQIGPLAQEAVPALKKLINAEETPTSVRAAAKEALEKTTAPPDDTAPP